jgi:hypothetical protein
MVSDAPPLATELFVEARSGGTCVVRLVHSLFATSDEWDDQLEGFESGWPPFFQILQINLSYFRGQECSAIRVTGDASGSQLKEAWEALTASLGLGGAIKGQRRSAPHSGVPPYAGTIERIDDGQHNRDLILRLDEPAPGVALLGIYACGGPVQVSVSLYLFGDRAPTVAAKPQTLWNTWMNEQFPSVGQANVQAQAS